MRIRNPDQVINLYLKTGDDAGLADADALLLHGLVYAGPVRVVHLVELVDQADALVRQHQGTRLQRPLLERGHEPHDTNIRRNGGKDTARSNIL
jgi:hypothetical protein